MYNAIDIARWFLLHNLAEQMECDDVEGISNLKLQKLLYYAQGCYLALHKERLFSDPIVAWQHGPVVEAVYQEYKRFRADFITDYTEPEVKFSEEVENVLLWVYNEFGQYTAWALRNMTHKEKPWLETAKSSEINVDLIKEYFLANYVEA